MNNTPEKQTPWKARDYRLPKGQRTKSTDRYIREWNKLSKPVAKALGCDVIGVDPSIHLMEKGCHQGFQISCTVAARIRDLYLLKPLTPQPPH